MSKWRNFAVPFCALAFTIVTSIAPTRSLAQDDKKGAVETIDCTAMGTSTQLGQNFSVTIRIERYATEDERKALVDAFMQGKSDGLIKKLEKMPSMGRISLPSNTGYQLAFVREIPTATGRKIRFVTDRPLKFGEVRQSTRSTAYGLTAGEIDINDSDKGKTTGVLFPAAQLIINAEGELQMELFQNPWKLVNIIEWKKKD